MVLHATDGHPTGPERVRILDAAEKFFYARGLQQVGMDQLREEAGVSLKRLYREFPSKDHLVEAYLIRRDARWLESLRVAIAGGDTPAERLDAAFGWLGAWFTEPGFRGCAFTNSFGELGARSAAVAAIAAAHKREFRAVFVDLVNGLATERPQRADQLTAELGEQLYLLAEGAITAAAITGDSGTARSAHAGASLLLEAALGHRSHPDDAQANVGAGCRPSGTGPMRAVPTAVRRLGGRLAGIGPLRRIRLRRPGR